MNNIYRPYILVLVQGLGVVLCTSTAVSPAALAKKSGSGLKQLPSVITDYPEDNPNAVEVHATTAKKDIIGSYHVRGEIKNIGDDTLQFVKIKAHFYDGGNQTVGATSCCYADPTEIEPGHTSTFDSFVMKDGLSGKPDSDYRLSFNWR